MRVLAYEELLSWWTISISWSAAFLVAVSIYLYWDRRRRFTEGARVLKRSRVTDFVFVWVLLGLLALYIISIYHVSALLFAAGNLVVEITLIIYTLKNRT